MTDHNEATPSEAATVPEPATSERQVLANRQNAQASTGPATADGKARSSQNALKHGLYASGARAVQRGALRENQEELDDKLDVLTASLYPRDAIEEVHARRIATIVHKMDRLDVVEVNVLDADTRAATQADRQRQHEHDDLCDVVTDMTSFSEWLAAGQPTETLMAVTFMVRVVCRYKNKGKLPEPIQGIYKRDDLQSNMVLRDSIMAILLDQLFNRDVGAARLWAIRQVAELTDRRDSLAGSTDELASVQMLASLERISKLGSRYGSDLARAIATYSFLRSRPIGDLMIESHETDQ